MHGNWSCYANKPATSRVPNTLKTIDNELKSSLSIVFNEFRTCEVRRMKRALMTIHQGLNNANHSNISDFEWRASSS
jgi:hypothetical protein